MGNGTRVPNLVLQMRNTLRNGALTAKMGIFTLCSFAAISQLRNEGSCSVKWHSCAKLGFAATKQMLLCCEVALVCHFHFRNCENSRRESQSVAKWFGNKVLFSQKFSSGCEVSQSPVFTLFLLCFCSDFAPISSFQFLCILSHLRSFKNIKLHIKTYFKIKN